LSPIYSGMRACSDWGLVSKRRDSVYRAGRSPHWIKAKSRQHHATERVME
jgi:ATP-dependent DNA ligase